jgi:hypothetical protein
LIAFWEPRPGEPAKAYRAFCIYRDLGRGRSLDQASRVYHQTSRATDVAPARRPRASGTIRSWAARWQWGARARAWDEEQSRIYEEVRITQVMEMAERQANAAMLLQQKAVERLCQLPAEELTPREALNCLMQAAKLERLARNQTVPESKTPWWVDPAQAKKVN